MGNSVKKKPRQPVGIRTARMGRKPVARPHPTDTYPNHNVVPSCSPGVDALRPRLGPGAPQDPDHRGPHRGPVMGERRTTGARAWRSLLALSPTCGHHPRASGLRHTRAPRTAALGIPGLHDASPEGLSDGPPPYALGPVLDFLRISVSSAVHLRLAKRSGREHGVTAPAYSRNHGAGAAAPYPVRLR